VILLAAFAVGTRSTETRGYLETRNYLETRRVEDK